MADNPKIVDLGFKRIIKNTKGLDDYGISTGIHEDAGTYDGGITVAGVYAVHEFGTQDGRVPARSTLGPTMDANMDSYEADAVAITKRVQDGSNPRQELQKLALRMETDVKKAITDLREPELKPATIARKGSDNPLIDTTRMRNSVQGRVVKGEEQDNQ